MKREASRKPLTWIESTGGPLLLLETELLPFWRGILTTNAGMMDYDRACQITSYVGEIQVGSGFGIVLSGEPLSTSWYTSNDLRDSFVVRWVYAEDEGVVLSALSSMPNELPWEPTGATLEINHQELTIFDSSCPGTAIDAFLAIELSVGRYSIETLKYEPTDELSLLLHRFRPSI